MELNKQPTETDYEYIKRIVYGKLVDKTIDLDYELLSELIFGESNCFNSSEVRKRMYGMKRLIDIIEKDGINTIQDDSILKQLEQSKREIFKERQKLRDEKNEYNTWLREQSRLELFFERIDEATDKLINKKPKPIPSPVEINNNNPQIVCAFADCHYGAHFDIRGFSNEILNKYNPDIFMERMWNLRDEILEFCKINNSNTISIVDLGDSIEGLLHISQLKSLKNNIVDDIIDYAEFIADWLINLSHEEIKINFYMSEGNHSELRIITGNKGDFPHENLEKIYARVIQRLLKDNPNVEVFKSLNGLNYFNVNGFNILTAHGNDEKNIKNSIKEYEDTYNININYMLVGHLHYKNEIEVSNGKEIIQVRSIMGLNDYSTGIKKTSTPGALIFTVHNNYGKKYVNEVKFY